TQGCASCLHDSGSAVAGRELRHGYLDAEFHSGWMFDKVDIDGGSREQATGEDSNEFSNLAHRFNVAAAGVYSAAIGRIGGGRWLFGSNMRISQCATSMAWSDSCKLRFLNSGCAAKAKVTTEAAGCTSARMK